MQFGLGHNDEDRTRGVTNIIKACSVEASMMARCTGKTNLQNVEPEDLRAITLATAEATGIPLVGTLQYQRVIRMTRCMFPQAPGARIRALGLPRINSGARSRLPECEEHSGWRFRLPRFP